MSGTACYRMSLRRDGGGDGRRHQPPLPRRHCALRPDLRRQSWLRRPVRTRRNSLSIYRHRGDAMSAPARIAEGEIMREGRRLLRKLMQPSAKLVPCADLSFALTISQRQPEGQGIAVSAELVDAFRRRDWIEPAQDDARCFVLSDVG